MGNNHSGVAGDPRNNCTYCKLGKSFGWLGNGVFHTHDNSTPLFFQETEDKDPPKVQTVPIYPPKVQTVPIYPPKVQTVVIDPLTYLGGDVQVNEGEVKEANKSVHQFFAGSGVNPQIYLDMNIVLALAKVSKYRIRKPLNISDEIQLMIQHAKMGDFDTAIGILDKHQGTCIVNCIPPKRAWGLLHQAAFHNNLKAVDKILENPKCDPFLRTKITRDGSVEPSSTADKITKDENVKKSILKHQEIRKQEMEKSAKPDLVSVEFEKDITVESIFLVINTFENVLHPKSINSQHDMIYSNLMLNVFNYINTGNNWERARKEVSLQLQSLNVFDAIFLATGKENSQITDLVFEKKQDFYSRVICLYTKECEMTGSGSSKTKTFYRALNYSLLKKGCEHSFVSGEDLALAAYGLLLNAILMYWTNLVPTNEPTYRGMNLSGEQLACYKEGQTLTWLCFNSSSLKQSVSNCFGNTQFICDNTQMTKYAAKGIKELSQFSGEEEFLYPSGARFRITKIEKNPGGTKLWIRFEDY